MTWVKELRADGDRDREKMVLEVRAIRDELVERMHQLEVTTIERMRAFESRVDDRFARVEVKIADVQSNLMKWSFVFWCGAVAAIAALAGVLRP